MSSVLLNKKTQFVIYGAGEVGNNCYKALSMSGYTVVYGLDRSAHGNDVIEGIMTYKMGEDPESDSGNKVVIICLANGLIHPAVAKTLFAKGYRYIVFLPMGECIRDEEKRRITRDYNYILTGEIGEDEISVSDYCEYDKPDLDVSNAVIRDYGDEYIVWCRLEMLHSESVKLWTGDLNKIFTKTEFKDRNICIDPPVKRLFDYFSGKEETPDAYFESKKTPPSPEERTRDLLGRQRLYELFENEYNKGMDFFIEGAPSVVWNPRCYFNLVGGHHRTLYLLHKGHTLFPVKVKKEDFHNWINEKKFNNVRDYVYRNGIRSFYAPIPHPGFLNFPSEFESHAPVAVDSIMNYVYKTFNGNVKSVKCLDTLDDEGYFARVLERMGVSVSVYASFDADHRDRANLLNDMLYRDNVRVSDHRSLEVESFDLVICKGEDAPDYREKCNGCIITERTVSESDDTDVADHLFSSLYMGKQHVFCVVR